MALNSISDVGERFILNATRFWWAHKIAIEYHINPVEVKKWDAEEVLEALAAIGLMANNMPKEGEGQ